MARGRASGGGAPTAAQMVAAGQRADRAALARLVARGGDVNASWRNYRPLHALLQERPLEGAAAPAPARLACLDWLLAHGADPDAHGAWPSARARLVAAFVGVPEFVERLVRGAARDDLHLRAALGERAAVARALARPGACADARDVAAGPKEPAEHEGLTPLHACAGSRLGRRDERVNARLAAVATLLLDAGADASARVRSWGDEVDVAYFAIGTGNLALLELLLARGADADAALASAAWHADRRLAEAALRRGAAPDRARAGDRPILNELVRWGQLEHARWLLEHGASPDVPDPRGWTALHQAATRGNERMFRALLAAGADPRRPDAAGHSPLDLVCAKGNRKLLALLTPWTPGGSRPARRRKA